MKKKSQRGKAKSSTKNRPASPRALSSGSRGQVRFSTRHGSTTARSKSGENDIKLSMADTFPRSTPGVRFEVWKTSVCYLPLRTVNSLNAREHWAKRAKRAKQERHIAFLLCGSHWTVFGWPKLPATVRLTRIAPRMMDDDGMIASLKNIRDGIADRLGINDGGGQVLWAYAQRKGKPKEYAVEVEIMNP